MSDLYFINNVIKKIGMRRILKLTIPDAKKMPTKLIYGNERFWYDGFLKYTRKLTIDSELNAITPTYGRASFI
jgi:hypothetical protein